MQTTNRNYMFDNIKALMLFLVALGHTLDVYIDTGNFELYLIKPFSPLRWDTVYGGSKKTKSLGVNVSRIESKSPTNILAF